MQVGSYVECVKAFAPMVKAIAKSHGDTCPEPGNGETYLVEEVEPCSCGEHDHIGLAGLVLAYDARHFAEVAPPVSFEALLQQETVTN